MARKTDTKQGKGPRVRTGARQEPPTQAPETATAVLESEEDEQDEGEEEPEPQATADPPPADDERRIPRAGRLPRDEFFAFCAQFPEPKDLVWYLYRSEPVIIVDKPPARNGKKPTNIDSRENQAPTYEHVVNSWGSGKYTIRLLDKSRRGTTHREICQCKFSIDEWDAHPPIFTSWSELVDCAENRNYIDRMIRQKVIRRTSEGRFVAFEEALPTAPAAGAGDPVAMAREGLNFARDIIATTQKPAAGADKIEEHAGLKAIDAMGAIVAKVVEGRQQPQGGGSNDRLIELMITQQNTMFQAMLEMKQARGGNSTLTDILAVGKFLSDAGILKNLGKGGGGDPDIWSQLVNNLPAILNSAGNGLSSMMQSRAAAEAAAKNGGYQPAPAPAAIAPASAPVATASNGSRTENGIPASTQQGIPATPAPATSPATAAPQATEADAAAAAAAAAGPMQPNNILHIGRQVLEMIDRGVPGQNFANAIVTFYRVDTYAMIRAMGIPGIKAAFRGHPQLWPTMQLIERQLDEFLTEFMSYGDEIRQAAA